MKQELAPKTAFFAVMAVLVAACSAGSVTRNPVLDQSQYQYTAPPSSGTGFSGSSASSGSGGSGGSGSSGSSSGGSTSGGMGVGGTGLPPIQTRVGTIGYNSFTVQIDVRSVLKVKFAPGVQDETVQGTGYAPAYSHLGVYINVGTKTQATEMLSNGLLDGKPQTSSVIDFSSAFTQQCDPTDKTCHQTVTIKVFKPNNDYYCLNFRMYCPWAQMYETHPWHGTLYIETDDTDPI